MRRRLFATLVALLLMAVALPAAAITKGGVPDDGEHPQVGQLLFFVPDAIDPRFGPEDPGAWFNCSGTLLDSTTVLTAGHCTFAVGLDGESTTTDGNPRVDTNGDGVADNGDSGNDIWFITNEEVDYGFLPPSTDYIDNGGNEARYEDWRDALNDAANGWTRGVAHPHTKYNDALFLLHDAGVVELGAAIALPGGFAYGELPAAGYLDEYLAGNGKQKAHEAFYPVGYGLNSGFPFFAGGDSRWKAEVMIVDGTGVLGFGPALPGTAVIFSNSPGKAHPGGTCFGDSGGPVFHEGTTVVAVTSFGLSQTCTGVGGGYRIDQVDDLAFINSWL